MNRRAGQLGALVLPALLAALAGCKERARSQPAPPPESPAAHPTAAVAPTEAATEAQPPSDPAALTFAKGTPEAELHAFCVANYEKMLTCFDDAAFWDVLSTLFFAQNPDMDDGTAGQRQSWIGMRKDDLASLARDHRIGDDCDVSIRRMKWPTGAARAKVIAARQDSCASFANAFGRMVFVERAFYDRRPGVE